MVGVEDKLTTEYVVVDVVDRLLLVDDCGVE